MSAILSIIAGVIGANLASEQWPRRAFKGVLNLLFGMVGGLAVWGLLRLLAVIVPSLPGVLMIMALGILGGALMTIALSYALKLHSGNRRPLG